MSFRITLVHQAKFPVVHYGGTERVVWWLAQGLFELGHQVQLVCSPGSTCPFAKSIGTQINEVPPSDIIHFFNTPEKEPNTPYIVTIEGNGKSQEVFLPNTVFVSENHANRHGATAYVYNGLNPDDYFYEHQKDFPLLFLAKASWNVKNVKGAIRIARQTQSELNILGGRRSWLPSWRGIYWRGMLGGKEKAVFISKAKGLLFPVLWNEPFGIAVTESLVSGTPVLATPFGSMKELIHPEVGKICTSYQEFYAGVRELGAFKPEICRDWALSKFHYRLMTQKYLEFYERILSGEKLNPQNPKSPDKIDEVPFFLPEF